MEEKVPKMAQKNPWDVETLEDFLLFCCPECGILKKAKEDFLQHAVDYHERSKGPLEKFCEFVTVPLEDDDFDIEELDNTFSKLVQDTLTCESPQKTVENSSKKVENSMKSDESPQRSVVTPVLDLESPARDLESPEEVVEKSVESSQKAVENEKESVKSPEKCKMTLEPARKTQNSILKRKKSEAESKTNKKAKQSEEQEEHCTCEKCDKIFLAKSDLKSHVHKHHNLKVEMQEIPNKVIFRCPVESCVFTSFTKCDISTHYTKAHKTLPEPLALVCGLLENEAELKEEYELLENDQYDYISNYLCLICGNSYPTRRAFGGHIGMHKYVCKKTETFQCSNCFANFPHFQSYKDHLCYPKDAFECKLCDFGTLDEINFKVHDWKYHGDFKSNISKCAHVVIDVKKHRFWQIPLDFHNKNNVPEKFGIKKRCYDENCSFTSTRIAEVELHYKQVHLPHKTKNVEKNVELQKDQSNDVEIINDDCTAVSEVDEIQNENSTKSGPHNEEKKEYQKVLFDKIVHRCAVESCNFFHVNIGPVSRHFHRKHQVRPEPLPLKYFWTHSDMLGQLNLKAVTRFKCDLCGEMFPTKPSCFGHVTSKHR